MELTDDAELAELFDAVAETYGYQSEIVDASSAEARKKLTRIPNPMTKSDFIVQHLNAHLNEIVRNYRKALRDG